MKAELVLAALGAVGLVWILAERDARAARRQLILARASLSIRDVVADAMRREDLSDAGFRSLAELNRLFDLAMLGEMYRVRWMYLQAGSPRDDRGPAAEAASEMGVFMQATAMLDDAFAEADPVWRAMRRFVAHQLKAPKVNLWVFTKVLGRELRRKKAQRQAEAERRSFWARHLPMALPLTLMALMALGLLPQLLTDISAAAKAQPASAAMVAKIESPTKRREDPSDC